MNGQGCSNKPEHTKSLKFVISVSFFDILVAQVCEICFPPSSSTLSALCGVQFTLTSFESPYHSVLYGVHILQTYVMTYACTHIDSHTYPHTHILSHMGKKPGMAEYSCIA